MRPSSAEVVMGSGTWPSRSHCCVTLFVFVVVVVVVVVVGVEF